MLRPAAVRDGLAPIRRRQAGRCSKLVRRVLNSETVDPSGIIRRRMHCVPNPVVTRGVIEMAKLKAAVIPCLRARDLHETITFYERLGFVVSARHEEQGQLAWCELIRDEVRLQFHILNHPELPSAPVLSGILYFQPDDLKALAAEWENVVPFHWGPEIMAYGWLEFAFRDPNGYLIAFYQDTRSDGLQG